MKSHNILLIIVVLAMVGTADTFYLTYKHYSQSGLACSILNGCQEVLGSAYSMVGPIPLALLGLLYYVVLLGLLLRYLFKSSSSCLRYVLALSGCGLMVSGYLVFIQGFVIKAWCQYCVLSAGITLGIFAGVWYLNRVAIQSTR